MSAKNIVSARNRLLEAAIKQSRRKRLRCSLEGDQCNDNDQVSAGLLIT